ncbi:MAG: twin-arginine translocase TatA/TatE family subunit [Deltaproteobacteria bacterium]|nr:twin-arginine translocase TatA/TatE family subunit [Deltaproteobacteria bacterium]
MFGLGTTELIVIGVIVFLIFGARRLPEIGKGLGGAIREFRQVKKEITGEEEEKRDRNEKTHGENNPRSLESKLAGKVLDQVPGVKQARDVKEKVEKVKSVID